MSEITSLWWTSERVKATLSREYVASRLEPDNQDRLFSLPPWGEGLTSETYLDWILTKAGKLFLILDGIGIPDRIFDLINQSYDDSDLPVATHRVCLLCLSSDGDNPALDTRFFHTQWRFLVRSIREGEHIVYSQNEGVPVEVQRTGLTQSSRGGLEKVVLSGAVCRFYLRTQITIKGAPHFFEEDEVLQEIRSLRQLAHEHVFSVYASYFVDESIYVLFAGAYDRTLTSFLTDIPPQFKRLPKPQRREILINWPHCLANGLAWLHGQGCGHGAIRPSNVLVDHDYRIFLGQFEPLDTLLPPPKVNDVEAYQYAAPERWIRTVAVQEIGPSRTILPSGGRTARRQSGSNTGGTRLSSSIFSPDDSRSESTASNSTAIRVGSMGSPTRSSCTPSSSSSNSGGPSVQRLAIRKKPILYTPSITSSSSSDSTMRSGSSVPRRGPHAMPSPGSHTAVVQIWQSHQLNSMPSDVFSLAAVILDIITHLCKRKLSTFTHHRGAKNRTPGRGGGVADASFHLDRNHTQIASWITLLDHDAKKRKDPPFRAVGPILAMARQMLEKDPEKRPSALQVERHFARVLGQMQGILEFHCKMEVSRPATPSPDPDSPATDPTPGKQSSHGEASTNNDSFYGPHTPPDEDGTPVAPITSVTLAPFDFSNVSHHPQRSHDRRRSGIFVNVDKWETVYEQSSDSDCNNDDFDD